MKVSGYISDDYGKSDGATIQLMRNGEGTNLAVVSNQDGYFQIDNDEINEDDIFDIRFLGLKTKSFKASELQDIEIFLEEDIESLDEIVITSNIGKKPNIKNIIFINFIVINLKITILIRYNGYNNIYN